MQARAASLIAVIFLLAGCEPRSDNAEPPHADWVLRTHVAFLEADGRTAREPPREKLRVWMPYVVGDLYGSPNAGEISPVELDPELGFTLNLNLGHLKLERSLVPTQFSQKWLSIVPAEARVARLSPFVLPAEGITPFGQTEWLDVDTGGKLMVVYVDRPARMRGEVVYEGRSLEFDIEAKEAGYLWIRQPAGSGKFTAVPRPPRVVLAVLPAS